VEAAFRSLKSDDLKIRPIYHYTEDRVRAHLFLCMLAYYVKWHMTEAWRPLLFADTEREHRAQADPVAPATRSDAALEKVATKTLDDGTPAHSFRTVVSQIIPRPFSHTDPGYRPSVFPDYALGWKIPGR
ncbi:hypothetical protein ACI5FT_16465, partial [Ectothiorhodospira haloalkaliphila]